MIRIEKDQEVAGEVALRVAAQSGEYEDTALIECYDIARPAVVAGAYQAQYVRYGSLVYRCTDPIELGTEILKIDPESTHTAAAYVRMSRELLSQMQNGSLEPESLDQAIATEKEDMEDKREEPQDTQVELEDTSEPDDTQSQVQEEPAPAPVAPLSPDVSTTTPKLIDTPAPEMPATTTPEILEAPATTTPEVVRASKKLAGRLSRRA